MNVIINRKKNSIIFIPVRLKRHRDINGGHRHIILENIGDRYVSVGLSSKNKKGSNSTNYQCENDILGSGSRSYMRRQGTVDKIKNYYGNETTGVMTPKDYRQARIYGERAKEKYLSKKKK